MHEKRLTGSLQWSHSGLRGIFPSLLHWFLCGFAPWQGQGLSLLGGYCHVG